MLSEIDNFLDEEHIIIKDVICSLSKFGSLDKKNAQHRLNGNLKKLSSIYKLDSFRHKYSKIFIIISAIDKDNALGLDLDYLMQSMEIAIEHVSKNSAMYSEEFNKNFCKLYDHVILEILQIKYMKEIEIKGDQNNEKTIKELKDAKNIAEKANKNSEEAIINIKNAKDKLDNIQKDYITILGIFAAIIVAFVASFTFSTSVLNNIDKASIYRLITVISILSIFIVNVLNSLYIFLKQIHYREEAKINYKFLFIFNCCMLLIMIATLLIWVDYHPYKI
ncbi:Uncharacterised protein [Campylobacter sputorum subsp. bubulus]|uniref:Uncharacterized protein n=1 Tax=Campylobacter sputorum subsp. sputorum TaxID=32024 RepID=A0A381DKY8_9BACT|nr:hypothetical protein [Campylobacter sputorum]ASM34649.1 putative membrane protein [Campylobacter sputorum aubsp. sputorum RM3237]KAB0581137.1 hypothetical protein F7P64_07220 [Campylobacter sputorum subsp. sputorum]QEL04840.1 putative membrane protein [Campylobacter sputorum subsp. sputorum]SUX09848.1 Uncharacterised protein [Campylobacter sputorum subsp. bubulus]SUX11326.1 Uncharacterised protein [Campylobacter sputorum subsp. sputorum]